MTSENYRVREPFDVPSQLSIDHDLSMTCVFLSLCLQSWIIYIQWYVFRTWFVVTMPTDIAFILGCAVFMKLSWINQVSRALMVDHGLDWFTRDLLQPKEFREIKAYLPIKTFKLRKLFEQFIFLLDGILAPCNCFSFIKLLETTFLNQWYNSDSDL